MQISDIASEKIKSTANADGKPGFLLRIAIQGGGCSGLSYKFSFVEKAEEKDLVFENNGSTIVVDPKSHLYLKGSLLDYQQTLMKTGFVIKNPNEKTSCGCGKSFGV